MSLDNIEQILALPTLQRVEASEDQEGGYYYAKKYIGNVFIHDNKLVTFTKNSVIEFPLPLVEAILKMLDDKFITSEQFEDISQAFNSSLEGQASRVDRLINKRSSELEHKIQEQEETINILREKINDLSTSNADLEKLNSDFNTTVSSMVDAKLVDVHRNFNLVVAGLVAQEVDKIKGIILNNANKLKPGTIMIYKEMGLTIEQIISLKQSDMI
jgi:uncharacterized protein YoxC